MLVSRLSTLSVVGLVLCQACTSSQDEQLADDAGTDASLRTDSSHSDTGLPPPVTSDANADAQGEKDGSHVVETDAAPFDASQDAHQDARQDAEQSDAAPDADSGPCTSNCSVVGEKRCDPGSATTEFQTCTQQGECLVWTSNTCGGLPADPNWACREQGQCCRFVVGAACGGQWGSCCAGMRCCANGDCAVLPNGYCCKKPGESAQTTMQCCSNQVDQNSKCL